MPCHFIRISLKPNLFSPLLLFSLSWLLLFVVIHIHINVSLSILSFHNLSPRLKHGECEGCWSRCSDFPTSNPQNIHTDEFSSYMSPLVFIATHNQFFGIPPGICPALTSVTYNHSSFWCLIILSSSDIPSDSCQLYFYLQFVIPRIRAHAWL